KVIPMAAAHLQRKGLLRTWELVLPLPLQVEVVLDVEVCGEQLGPRVSLETHAHRSITPCLCGWVRRRPGCAESGPRPRGWRRSCPGRCWACRRPGRCRRRSGCG